MIRMMTRNKRINKVKTRGLVLKEDRFSMFNIIPVKE